MALPSSAMSSSSGLLFERLLQSGDLRPKVLQTLPFALLGAVGLTHVLKGIPQVLLVEQCATDEPPRLGLQGVRPARNGSVQRSCPWSSARFGW